MADERQTAGASAADADSLDGIFRINVRRHPDALALIDPPDRGSFADGPGRRLTYAQADAAVAALAQRLQQWGLRRGSVVGLQLPNCVEMPIALLAALRTGLVAAPMPLLWRRADAVRALAQVGAKALLVGGRLGDVDLTAAALPIAAEAFSIRIIGAFSADPPDGVVRLDEIFAATDSGQDASRSARGAANEAAIATFDVGTYGSAAVVRTHAEILAGGLAIVLEAGLPPRSALLGTMLGASFAGLATTFVPWLLTGGTLTLHQPFDAAVLRQQATQAACDAMVVPAPLADLLAQDGAIGRALDCSSIIGVWRTPHRYAASPRWPHAARLIDVLAFGEIGLVALRRGPAGETVELTAGPVTAPSASENGAPVVHLSATSAGTLALRGAMVPRPRDHVGGGRLEIDTGYPCRVDPATGAIALTGGPRGLASVGGYRFFLRELQDAVARLEPDGRLAALPDLLAGEKLAGLAGDAAALRAALRALGHNPLIADAFR